MALLFPSDWATLIACGVFVVSCAAYVVVLIVRGFFED